jgi:hypothetical protein
MKSMCNGREGDALVVRMLDRYQGRSGEGFVICSVSFVCGVEGRLHEAGRFCGRWMLECYPGDDSCDVVELGFRLCSEEVGLTLASLGRGERRVGATATDGLDYMILTGKAGK